MQNRKSDEIDGLLCPISGEVFRDPVIAADGHTYEKSFIEKWLKGHDTSPVTGVRLAHKRLLANWTVKGLVDEVPRKLMEKEHELASLKLSSDAREQSNSSKGIKLFDPKASQGQEEDQKPSSSRYCRSCW